MARLLGEQALIFEPGNQLGDIRSSRIPIHVELRAERILDVFQASVLLDELPNPCAAAIQGEIPAGFQVQKYGLAVQDLADDVIGNAHNPGLAHETMLAPARTARDSKD
jgi:hypothetical protein